MSAAPTDRPWNTPVAGETTIVHVCRHGLVDNPRGVLYGRLPGFRLAETGRAQAERTADYLRDRDIVAAFSSPLLRAQETIRPIAAAHGLADDVITLTELIESGNDFEGNVVTPETLRRRREWWPKLRNPFAPSWGEEYHAVARRMTGALYTAFAAARGHEAVCVSHQLPIVTLRRSLEGRPLWHDPRHRQCGVASVTSIRFLGSTPVGVHYYDPATGETAEVELGRDPRLAPAAASEDAGGVGGEDATEGETIAGEASAAPQTYSGTAEGTART